MRKLISDEASYWQTVALIAQSAEALVYNLVKIKLPIDTITIFAQSAEEYAFVEGYLLSKGKRSGLSHNTTLYIEPDNLTVVHNYPIKFLGVRKPDKTRPEIGYADFPVTNYEDIKERFSDNAHVNQIISGTDIPLLELRHPDYDVRGYIVEK
jgi:hypothetical protein